MNPHPHTSGGRAKAAVLGSVAAALFLFFSGLNLTGQGLYYDELHQAPTAFAWLGKSPTLFNAASFHGFPVLNMTYNGAIKSNFYGLYMKCTHAHFSVRSWRLMGIGFVAAGILLFSIVAGPHMPRGALFIFLLLMISDITVLLNARHDWGPIALALLLRLSFIAVWVNREAGSRKVGLHNLLLGFIAGFAIYEKLSSVVLIAVLFIVSLISVRPMRRRDRIRH